MSSVISELEPGDIAQACQLFQEVFGSAISPAQWRWKYLQGPRLGNLNLVARAANGELLAHVGASAFPGVMRGGTLAMVQLGDFMVSSSARGGYSASTVYPRLMKTLQQMLAARFAAPYAYGFAGVRQFKLGIRLGYYRVLQNYRPVYFKSDGSGAAFWRVREIDWDSERLDTIWSRRVAEIASPRVARSGAYLSWRYRDHPVNRYRLWLLMHLSRERGWFITRTMPNGEICIIDALLPASSDPARLLATLVAALANSMPVLPPIYSWLSQTEANQSIEPVVGGEFKLARWHNEDPNPVFQPGDTDVF